MFDAAALALRHAIATAPAEVVAQVLSLTEAQALELQIACAEALLAELQHKERTR